MDRSRVYFELVIIDQEETIRTNCKDNESYNLQKLAEEPSNVSLNKNCPTPRRKRKKERKKEKVFMKLIGL